MPVILAIVGVEPKHTNLAEPTCTFTVRLYCTEYFYRTQKALHEQFEELKNSEDEVNRSQ